jgi:hypothetical protein
MKIGVENQKITRPDYDRSGLLLFALGRDIPHRRPP